MKNWIFVFVVLFLIICINAQSQNDIIESDRSRNPKIFPFLAVISFPNSKCTDPTAGDGLCYTATQCTRKGGVATATTCAQNYGVCCIFRQSCSGTPPTLTVRNNLTQLIGMPNTNMAIQQPCQIRIPKQDGVCQVRIDFTTFSVGTALGDGTCPSDFVSFKGANLPDGLTLCGVNHGKHVYLHYGQLDSVMISTNLITSGSSYDIKVTMIKCNSTERAPDGCTQYYTSSTAEVQSYNFPFQQLNSERYTACVASQLGQSIRWTFCSAPNNTFFISGFLPNMPISGDNCLGDYVLVPPGDKLCGSNYTGSVTSPFTPFLLYVNFDDSEVPIPSGPPDPLTGCPAGWTCARPDGGTMCMEGDTCVAPPYYPLDAMNPGFCLKYTIES